MNKKNLIVAINQLRDNLSYDIGFYQQALNECWFWQTRKKRMYRGFINSIKSYRTGCIIIATESKCHTQEHDDISAISEPKGTLPLDKLLQSIEQYEEDQRNHIVKRDPKRLASIMAATYWCKEIAKGLTN